MTTERTITTATPSPTPIRCVSCGVPSPLPQCDRCQRDRRIGQRLNLVAATVAKGK